MRKKNGGNKPPLMTTAEFREHIRRICGADKYSIVGASHADPCLVRKPTDAGYNPTRKKGSNNELHGYGRQDHRAAGTSGHRRAV